MIQSPCDAPNLERTTLKDAELATIAATLAQYDVPYLRISTKTSGLHPLPQPLDPHTLIQKLAQHTDPRVREALIPLFLRHPEYHQFVHDLVFASNRTNLDQKSSRTLRHFYTAAVYLQHLWRGSLSLYLGMFSDLPNYFGETEFGLPSPQIHWGEAGLRVLAARFEQETGDNWLTTYESALSRFLAQRQLKSFG